MKITHFFCKPPKITGIITPGVGDGDHVVNVDPSAEKKAQSFQRKWLKEWLCYENGSMHCVHCKACGTEVAGNTAFITESTHFKCESLIKQESVKHKKCSVQQSIQDQV